MQDKKKIKETAEKVVGMRMVEAIQYINDKGYKCRVTWNDGQSINLQNIDYWYNRINLTVKNNKVDSAKVG